LGPQEAIGQIVAVMNDLAETHGLDRKRIRFGISCGGPLDSHTGTIYSPPNLPGWDEVPIVRRIEEAFGGTGRLQNDANACALAEWRYGAARGYQNAVYLTFGTGMGAGLILNGRLYEGGSGLAGEVGHVRIAPDGPVGYGKAGSFEGYCSGGGIAQLARRAILRRVELGEPLGFAARIRDVASITAEDVGRAAANGDPVAIDILTVSGRYLGLGVSILIDILNPEAIIIGSIYARCQQFLEGPMREVIAQEALAEASKACKIVPPALGEAVGDYAALATAVQD
ncbi:MAG: ROK family protein, partial [Bacillota bacterium]